MAKQLNVNLAFTADTSKARQQLQDLQRTLNGLTTSSAQSSPLGITNEINEAIVGVTKLEAVLKKATTNTGSLDLEQFRQELNKAGLSAEKIADQLIALGPAGQQAFMKLTQSILTAEIPLKKTSTLLTEFSNTLKNTARWQISSSLLHGFMGSIQKAYGYAQDLNESLNNIRIVTGYSTDRMAEFADEANKAAKALNTTTTEYTDAALIYYQQGLSDEEAKERTDVTVKMANITHESAEDVSQQMTAVWNNFDDGSKSLEYYADVMTALGAATASSTDEIAQGLEKFSAVADTVGLSYEYATSALATVTATTRQSADIVGNAFKTLFARIEGLELGETLDDGTDLNKYSQALAAVGVNIKDANGDMKEMDQILDELGAKWQTLGKDQQIALAQTVAGVRQYTQMIALMDNWDFFQKNLDVAKGSEGALQEQVNIFAQSWEAARNNVKASMQAIYDDLLDDEFFVRLLNGFSTVIDALHDVIESFDGLKGIIPFIGTMLLNMFGKDLSGAIDNFAYNFKLTFSNTTKTLIKERQEWNNQLIQMQTDMVGGDAALGQLYKEQGEAQNSLIAKTIELSRKGRELSEVEQGTVQFLLDQNSALIEQYQLLSKNVELTKQATIEAENEAIINIDKDVFTGKKGSTSYSTDESFLFSLNLAKKNQQALDLLQQSLNKLKQSLFDNSSVEDANSSFNQLLSTLEENHISLDELPEPIQTLWERLSTLSKEGKISKDSINDFILSIKKLAKEGKITTLDSLVGKIKGTDNASEEAIQRLKDLAKAITDNDKAVVASANGYKNAENSIKTLQQQIDALKGSTMTMGQQITNAGQIFTNTAMALTTFKSLIDTISNPDVSGWEKFTAIFMNIGMLIPTVIRGFESLKVATQGFEAISLRIQATKAKNIALTQLETAETGKLTTSKFLENTALKIQDSNVKKLNLSEGQQITIQKLLNMNEQEQIAILGALKTSQLIRLGFTKKEIEALRALKAQNDATNLSLASNPYGWIILAIGAVVAGLSIWISHAEKLREEQKELNKEAYEASKSLSDAAKEESDATTELYTTYLSFKHKLDDSTEAKENLKTATENLCESLGVEWDALDKLQGKYENVNKEILKAERDKIQKTIKTAQQTQSDAKTVVGDTLGVKDTGLIDDQAEFGYETARLKDDKSSSTFNPIRWLFGPTDPRLDTSNYIETPTRFYANADHGWWMESADTAALEPVVEWLETNYADKMDVFGRDEETGKITGQFVFKEGVEVSEAVNILKEAYRYLEDEVKLDPGTKEQSDTYQWLKELYYNSDMTTLINDSNTAAETIEESIAQLADIEAQLYSQENDPSQIKNLDDLEEYKQGYIEQLKATMTEYGIDVSQYTDEYFEQIANDYLSGIEGVDAIVESEGLVDSLVSRLGEDSRTEIEEFVKQVTEEGGLKALIGLEIDEESSLKQIKLQYEVLKNNLDLEAIQVDMETVSSAQDTISSGEELPDEQAEALQTILEASKAISMTWEDFSAEDTIDQMEILSELTDELVAKNWSAYEAQVEAMRLEKENYATRIQDITAEIEVLQKKQSTLAVGADLSQNAFEIRKLEKELEILQTKYDSIDIDIGLNLEDTILDNFELRVNDIVSQADTLKTAAELIGEGFLVAKEDAHEFAKVYPELLAQAQVLADGSIQLNQATVQAIMNGNAEVIESDSDVTEKQLEDKITLLDAEIQYQQTKLTILQNLLNGAIGESEAEQQLATAENTYKENLVNAFGQTTAEAMNQEMANHVTATDTNLKNLDIVDRRIEEISQHYSKMLSGEVVAATPGSGAVGGNSVFYTDSNNIDNVNQDLGQETVDAIKQQIEDTQSTLSTLQDQRAGYTALLSDLRGGTEEAIDAMSGAAAGTGGKIDSDDKDDGKNSKEKELKDHKKVDDELDRYWDINNAIKATSNRFEELSDEMEKTQTVADHLFGKALIANLKQQNEQLERENVLVAQQRSNYQALYAEQRRELSELESKLSGFGAQFNGDALANYSSLLSGALAAYNAAIDAYNASAQEDADKLALEAAEKQYTEIKETIDRYRTLYYTDMADTQDKLRDLEQQELENRLKILENNLKSWEVEIELKLNITEAKRKWDEFLKEVKQDFRKIYEDLTINSKFDRNDFFTYVDDVGTTLGAIRNVEAEMNKLKNGGSSDMFYDITEAQEKLKELQEQLIENGKSLTELYKQVWKNYISGLDQVQDKLKDINDQYERIDDELEYEKELIELLYGDQAYALMDKYYKAQSKNILAQIDSMRTQVNFWQSEFNKAYRMNKDKHNVDLNDMSTWTEDMQKAYKNMQSAQANLNDLILEGVKILHEEYLNVINEVIDTMDKNIWGMSLDDLKDNWDYIQKLADEYLDDIEGAYKIQTLANKIDQSIANTSSLQAQQKLQKLREEEIAMLREKENLTQDDIDLAEARYQIALKEIALEEAQQNKTSMKLTRDTSGNWTYQYVADEEDIMTKQQELLDAYNNLYQTADEAYAHAMELAMNTYETMQEKIREIAEDMTLSEEEKMQRIQEIYDTYLPEIEAAVGNSELYRQEAMMATSAVFAEVCEQDEEAYDTLTNAQKAMVDAVRDNHLEDYEEIRAAIVDGVYPELNDAAKTTFEETNMNSKTAAADIITDWAKNNGSSVRSMINAAINDMQKHIQNYEKELDNLQKIAGANFDKLGQMINKTSDKTDNLNDKTKQLCDDSAGYLSTLRSYVDEVAKAWDRVIAQIQTAKAELGDYLSLQFGGSSSGGTSGGSGNTGGGDSGSGSGAGGGKGYSNADVEGIAGSIWIYGDWDNNPTRHALMKQKFGDSNGDALYNAVQAKLNAGYGRNGVFEHNWDYYKDYGPDSYDTGGYTGTWDNTGRLAFLHQKELVLNADDTSNILKAVSAIRDLTSLNGSISSAIATSIGSMAMNLVANGGGNINTNSNSNAENQFYITAEFPNANDVETIREAILSLPNLASQYIHKNK